MRFALTLIMVSVNITRTVSNVSSGRMALYMNPTCIQPLFLGIAKWEHFLT